MAEPDPSPVLCHLSGNWARVAIDAYTRYTERCPDRTLMQFSAPALAEVQISACRCEQERCESALL